MVLLGIMRRYKPKTIPLASDALLNDSYCFRKHNAHQIGKILTNPKTSLEKIHLISNDLFASVSLNHFHCEESMDLWKIREDPRLEYFMQPESIPGLGRPNEVFMSLYQYYDNLPDYTVSLIVRMLLQNPENLEKLGVMANRILLQIFEQKEISVETIEESVDWIQGKMNIVKSGRSGEEDLTDISFRRYTYEAYADMLLIFARNLKCPAYLIELFCGSSVSELRDLAVESPLCSEEGRVIYALMQNG